MIIPQCRPIPRPISVFHIIVLPIPKYQAIRQRVSDFVGISTVCRTGLNIGDVLYVNWEDVGIVDKLVELAFHWWIDVELWRIRVADAEICLAVDACDEMSFSSEKGSSCRRCVPGIEEDASVLE